MSGKAFIQFLVFFVIFCLTPWVCADEATTEELPKILWGSDAHTGAPFVFYGKEDPEHAIGFEVDLMEAIGRRLNREPVRVQNDWESLIPGLERELYDIAVNGIGIIPERSRQVAFSLPYYIASGSLVVRKGNKKIHSLKDCENKRVGVIKGSEVGQFLKQYPSIKIRVYEDEVGAFSDLIYARTDGVLVDLPASLYYAETRPELKIAARDIGEVVYAIAAPKDADALLDVINEAILDIQKSGELRAILERWNLWNDKMADILEDFSATTALPEAYLTYHAENPTRLSWKNRLTIYIENIPLLLEAALSTLGLSLLSMIIAIFCGCVLAILRVYGPSPVSWLVTLYIEVVRGTPLLIQLLFIFYGLPSIGVKLSPYFAGVLGLSINYAAFEAENYRAGLISVPRGQMEAARALGMSQLQGLRHVVIPQAFRVVIPPMTNDFIALLKDSSLVSVITIVELTKTYTQLASTYYDFFGVGLLVAGIYLLLGLPFVRLARWAEGHLAYGKPKKR